MRVAKNWEQMKDLSNLSLRDVLQMLTEDRSDEETDPKEDKPVEFCTVEQFNRMSPSGTPPVQRLQDVREVAGQAGADVLRIGASLFQGYIILLFFFFERLALAVSAAAAKLDLPVGLFEADAEFLPHQGV